MDIKEKIEGRRKTRVDITIDQLLLKKLEKYKIKKEINMLSPMINQILWDWINEEEKE